MVKRGKDVSPEYELESFLKTFTTSSDRVRRLMIAAAVASILIFTAFWNLYGSAWHDARTRMVAQGVAAKIGSHKPPTDSELFTLWQSLVEDKHLDDPALKVLRSELLKVRANHLTWISMPFLGIQFDVNDLGALSAIGQSLIALLIAFSMARYQENLYICLWKVKRFAEDQGSFDDEKGHANMFYHSLAMAQVLSQPPTLARWEHNRIVELTSRSILFMPMAVQGIILYQDSKTFATGVSMSRSATMMSLQLQYLFFAILATCTCISLLYARAGDMRWARTFFVLNPRLRPIRQPSWWQWTSLIRNLNLHLEYDPDQEILVFGERHRSGRVHTVGLYLRSTFSPQLARPRARAKSWTGPSGQKLEFCPYGQGSALFRSSSISINQIAVGGKPKFSDGEGRAAGIGKIHAPLEVMVPFWSIFFVDGPRLRRIRTGTQQLRVETIAGDPFRAQRLRPFLPRLLDLAATDSSLLVADLDQRTVWALPLQEEIVAEDVRAYFRSESGWAPSRLLVRQPPEGKPTQTFLLEERPLDFKGLILRIFGRYRLLDISDPKEPIYLWGYG